MNNNETRSCSSGRKTSKSNPKNCFRMPSVDEFKLVKSRKSRRTRKQNSSFAGNIHLNDNTVIVDAEVVLKKLADLREELRSCEYFIKVKSVFEEIRSSGNFDAVQSIVCLGLGRFSSCSTALTQLAFLAELKDYLDTDDVQLYDPVFSDVEKQILVKLGYSVLHTNCEGKYIANNLSLFYFPHCPKQLINNFLWKNWNALNLENIILICNSFDKLISDTPERFLKKDAEYVLRISNCVKEYELENIYRYSDIFNDTSAHIFLKAKLQSLDKEEWQNNQEPVYSEGETELIINKLQTTFNFSNS